MAGLARRLEFLDFKGPILDSFAAGGVLQIMAENVLSQHSNGDWRFGIGKSPGWPFHELGEIEKERRLDLIFLRRFLAQDLEAENEAQKQNRCP